MEAIPSRVKKAALQKLGEGRGLNPLGKNLLPRCSPLWLASWCWLLLGGLCPWPQDSWRNDSSLPQQQAIQEAKAEAVMLFMTLSLEPHTIAFPVSVSSPS